MTISSTARLAGPFAGSGSTAIFPFSFKVFEAPDLYVASLNTATGAIAQLALTTDYTVTLNADQDSSPGGTITLTAGNLASGYSLIVTTSMAALQGLDLASGGAFYPDTINAALDTLTILVQQLASQVARSLQAPLVDAAPTVTLPPASNRAGMIPMFDTNGNLTLISLAPGAAVPGAQTAAGTIDGTNRNFTFAASSEATPVPLVFVGGVLQTPGDDYALTYVSGSTWQVAFGVAPAQAPVTILLFA